MVSKGKNGGELIGKESKNGKKGRWEGRDMREMSLA